MFTSIRKLAKRAGIRIPAETLDALGLHEEDRVAIVRSGDAITEEKAAPKRHRSVEERLTAFYGKPMDQIDRMQEDGEVDWGVPQGTEQW
ncbi:MAG: AbrB family transcriptional regulator [Oscillospiraceae bacterium]|nr:AbrB family transcriptional regulator [Oscillospiraceae bacterium]